MSQITTEDEASPDLSVPGLATARLYLCTDARRERGDFADFLRADYGGGTDVIQLRDKSLDAAEEHKHLGVLRGVTAEFGKPLAVNDRADLALLSGAPVFLVDQRDLPLPGVIRSLLGPAAIVGLFRHDPAQISVTTSNPITDYFCVGSR